MSNSLAFGVPLKALNVSVGWSVTVGRSVGRPLLIRPRQSVENPSLCVYYYLMDVHIIINFNRKTFSIKKAKERRSFLKEEEEFRTETLYCLSIRT